MKAAEVHELTSEELERQLDESRRELLNLRIQSANGTLENPARIQLIRRDVARMKTETRTRQLKESAK
jgi:large subunit ribosomal protein L29